MASSAFVYHEEAPLEIEACTLLFSQDEAVSLKGAARMIGRSVDTVRRWHVLYGIDRQAGPNAPIEISRVALLVVVHGDFAALELLRSGDREHETVRRYIDFVGVAA